MVEVTDHGRIDGEWYRFELLGGGEVDRYLTFVLQSNEGEDMVFTWAVSDEGMSIDVNCAPPGDEPMTVGEGEDMPGNLSVYFPTISADSLRELAAAAELAAEYLDEEVDPR